jgi:hypothetical protein
MGSPPRSAYDEVGGLCYFPRMLDKIRRFEAVDLRADFHENLGKGLDGTLCEFLRIDYADLRKRTLLGGIDEDVLAWCYENGRPLSRADILCWNAYATKLGWNDHVTETLERRKVESGLADFDEIQTMAEYFDFDEGRKG